ncbi:MAG TPA: radical SAM protein, partial [Flavobacteriales bacterium]|nr:radical SAM protein [Flavobacteriales bacterium]
MRDAAFRMIALARAAGCRVAVNSSDATDHAEAFLQAGADLVILGEGEPGLLDVLSRWDSDQLLDEVTGLAILRNGEVLRTQKRAVWRDL